MMFRQVTGPDGPHYILPGRVVAVGPVFKRFKGGDPFPARRVFLDGGHVIEIWDEPHNIHAVGFDGYDVRGPAETT